MEPLPYLLFKNYEGFLTSKPEVLKDFENQIRVYVKFLRNWQTQTPSDYLQLSAFETLANSDPLTASAFVEASIKIMPSSKYFEFVDIVNSMSNKINNQLLAWNSQKAAHFVAILVYFNPIAYFGGILSQMIYNNNHATLENNDAYFRDRTAVVSKLIGLRDVFSWADVKILNEFVFALAELYNNATLNYIQNHPLVLEEFTQFKHKEAKHEKSNILASVFKGYFNLEDFLATLQLPRTTVDKYIYSDMYNLHYAFFIGDYSYLDKDTYFKVVVKPARDKIISLYKKYTNC